MRHTLLIAAAVVCGLMSPTAADAYWWQGAGIGIGQLYRSLDYPTERRVPYFAAHPPVYYSMPVPRTYGYSPFAYTPDTRTPDVAGCSVQPLEIINPYVQPTEGDPASAVTPSKESAPVKNRTISSGSDLRILDVGPTTIMNPFVSTGSKTI